MNTGVISIRSIKTSSIFLAISLFLAGCPHNISTYDSNTYKNLTDLKATTSILFEKLTVDPTGKSLSTELESLRLDIEKAYEFEKGKAKNKETITQISLIREMYSEILTRFKNGKTFLPAQLEDKRENMMTAYDSAISTEKLKLEPK